MATAQGFRDLDVYKKALREARQIFEVSKTFPAEERYAQLDERWQHIGGKLYRMIETADRFCTPQDKQ